MKTKTLVRLILTGLFLLIALVPAFNTGVVILCWAEALLVWQIKARSVGLYVIARLKRLAESRDPDLIIGGRDDPYLKRWWVLPRNKFFNVYLHHFLRSDDDRALHDHPWVNGSFLLEGEYLEHMPEKGGLPNIRVRSAGDCAFRLPGALHRVQLYGKSWDPDGGGELPVWTLFVTGPRVREWGFACPKGWRHWKDFTKPGTKDSGVSEIGPGCGD